MYISLLKLIAALLLSLAGVIACTSNPISTEGTAATYYRVSRIIDGDTIVLANGQHIRYLGIDCPELHRQNQAPECGSSEAAEENRRIIGGRRVRLEADITDKDGYGRLLRHVYTESGPFVNYEMARRGWAQVFCVPPDIKYQAEFISAQLMARRENLGLWKKCFNQ